MAKVLMILLIGLAFESAGVLLLKKGMVQIGEPKHLRLDEVTRVVTASLTNSQVLLGVFFEALFFACLLVLMARSDISFLWPLTGLSFVFATLAAMLFLHEHITSIRWLGVALVVAGAILIIYSEHHKETSRARTLAPARPIGFERQ